MERYGEMVNDLKILNPQNLTYNYRKYYKFWRKVFVDIYNTTAKLNNLRPYYYLKYILTELPKLCDEQGNINPADLDYLMPWAEELPDECRKPRR